MTEHIGLIGTIVLFEFFSLTHIKVFLDQRAVLLLGREIGFPLQEIILMDSFRYGRFSGYGRWFILAIIWWYFSWKYALGLFVLEFFLSLIAPIPRASYREAMDRFKKISKTHPELEELYIRAKFAVREKDLC